MMINSSLKKVAKLATSAALAFNIFACSSTALNTSSLNDSSIKQNTVSNSKAFNPSDSKTFGIKFNPAFNPEAYFLAYGDIRAAIKNRTIPDEIYHYTYTQNTETSRLTGSDYLQIKSRVENKTWSEEAYLIAYPDIRAAIDTGAIESGYRHYYNYAMTSEPTRLTATVYTDAKAATDAGFSEMAYRLAYPDVDNAVKNGTLSSGYAHWNTYAKNNEASRLSNPIYMKIAAAVDIGFDEKSYLLAFPDINDAVIAGKFSSGLKHYIEQGVNENRLETAIYQDAKLAIVNDFNEARYRAAYPDVVAKIHNPSGGFASGFQHFSLYGRNEGRLTSQIYLDTNKRFTATLNGSQEVPAVTTSAMANATVMLNDDNTAMVTVKITSPLTGGAATGAHIHGPAGVGANAGVLFNLPLGSFSGFKITLTPDQVEQLRAGQFYINIHNAINGGGEIRGQLNLATTTPTPFNKTVYAVDTANMLVTFDSSTPSMVTKTAITGLQGGEIIVGLDTRPANNTLFGLGNSSRVYSINESTGAATLVGAGAFTPTLSGGDFGFDFNPVPDKIRVHSNLDQNLRLNPTDGAVFVNDSIIAYATGDSNVASDPNLVATAYTNSLPNAQVTTLYAIDSNLDILTTLAAPNDGKVSTRGALGFNVTGNAGFDIDPDTGMAYATLSTSGTNSGFYSINLTTGAATLIGTINTTTPITSMTFKQNP